MIRVFCDRCDTHYPDTALDRIEISWMHLGTNVYLVHLCQRCSEHIRQLLINAGIVQLETYKRERIRRNKTIEFPEE
jgi:hypothetical protein